jgi:molybdate transport system regulatory protein
MMRIMPKPTRYPGLTLRVLTHRSPAMGPGKAALIEAIDRSGSISGAAREMEMSYRRAWQLVDAINTSFAEPLIVTAAGGKKGGGAVVSDQGREVVRRFREMEIKASRAIAADIVGFSSLLKPVARSSKRG